MSEATKFNLADLDMDEFFTYNNEDENNNDENIKYYEAIMRHNKIACITYDLSGGGDSGDVSLESVIFEDGTQVFSAPECFSAVLSVDKYFNAVLFGSSIEDSAAGMPDPGWGNDNGESGYVKFRVYPDEPGLFFCISMCQNEPTDDEDFEDSDCFEDAENSNSLVVGIEDTEVVGADYDEDKNATSIPRPR
jgi:hypothetical protein